jgi:hypothetical protein
MAAADRAGPVSSCARARRGVALGGGRGGALIAGVVEGVLTARSALRSATAGFGALIAVPILSVAGLIARGLWIAWRPHRIAAALVDERRGAADRGVGIYPGLASAFPSGDLQRHPLVTDHVVQGGGRLARDADDRARRRARRRALSRPLVDAIAAGPRALGRRRAAAGRRALVTPWNTLFAMIIVVAIVAGGSWLI